ncbi:hypothetical protein J2751_002253 [Halorubrum alkaliphilum]|uniref:Uncharacterized protein n=1 Tax=Halorubrum alkaliphilum TaxID=261290 RepID=A0A8T4GFB8_9EURY|nr:hypothetical protein [Halorubrum alkaliphilum]MBP1923214.1 hypothetical protein [Halorubrum alkaliphilum]
MPSLPLTADPDAVPDVDEPEPNVDRGLPAFVGVPALAFVATAAALLVGGILTGEPVTWDAAPGLARNGLTAAGIAGGFQWLFGGDGA